MLNLLTKAALSIGSIFVTRDEAKGQIVVNAAPLIAASVAFTSIGCSISSEPFSSCMITALEGIKGVFGL